MKVSKLFGANLVRAAALAVAAVGASVAPAVSAGGEGVHVIDHEWSFEGPFGYYDRAQLQRGWQVYSEVCASCHSMKYVHYRDLGYEGGPAFPPEQVEAIAAGFDVPDIDAEGESIDRPAKPTDQLASPFPNEEAAVATHGANPPDLSLITKNRVGYHGILTQILQGSGGPEYVYSLLLGYREAPEGYEVPDGSHFNVYFKGHSIKMAEPLSDEQVEYQDGTKATKEQMAEDVTAFLMWAAEPKLEERKRSGFVNLIFLAIFAMLLWFSNKKLWKSVKAGGDA